MSPDSTASSRWSRWFGSGHWPRLQGVVAAGSAAEGLMIAAMPMLAVTITTDPQAVSLVNVVGQLPWLLLALFAGLLVDRVRRTSVLMTGQVLLLVAAGVLAVAGSLDALTLPLLLCVAFAVTTAQVLGDGASGALLPTIITRDRLPAANARMMLLERGIAQFIAPPVAGAVLALALGGPAWMACGAAVAALLLAAGLRRSAEPVAPPRPATRSNPFRDIAEGLRYLVAAPLLRAVTVTVALGSFAASATIAMLVLYVTQELGLGELGYGAMLACFAAGWVLMTFAVHRVVDRFGYSWSMRMSSTMAIVTAVLIAAAPPSPVFVGAVLALQSAAVLVWNVCSQSTRQRFTPNRLLGRVLTSHKMLAWGLTPLGALMGGFVAANWNLRGVWWIAAVVDAVAAAVVWATMTPRAFRHAEREHENGD
ncbi:MFS transporter [Saccharomonospora sp. CUA-673]|uniref:MFS transporter n=1 Tax=Saccharomonospora sp. CUA-673 TaxID=1904969 RepID=UPI000967F65E|nr:MFS transporter [Saccharomonospora sp. CUA-673]OLT48027.1 MFS transporter [Saccharomonospora sp. CUA-673]